MPNDMQYTSFDQITTDVLNEFDIRNDLKHRLYVFLVVV